MDAKRVGIEGLSRYGKAAIVEFWQGAIDSGLTDADLEPDLGNPVGKEAGKIGGRRLRQIEREPG